MAWAVDSISTPVEGAAVTTVTVSHVLGSGANRLVVAAGLAEGITVSSATYNGVAMTAATNPASGVTEARIFYMLDAQLPVAGTYNCVITFSATTNGHHAHCASFTGIAQAAPQSTVGQNYGNVSAISDSVTPTTDAALLFSALAVLDPRTITNDTGQANANTIAAATLTPRRSRTCTQLGPTPAAITAVSYTLSAASGTNAHHVAAFGIASAGSAPRRVRLTGDSILVNGGRLTRTF